MLFYCQFLLNFQGASALIQMRSLSNLIDIGERAGSGVPELFTVWEQEGWEEPKIEERLECVERTIVTLSFKQKVPKKSAGKNTGTV